MLQSILLMIMIIVIGSAVVLYFGTNTVESLVAWIAQGIESQKNKVSAVEGDIECDLKATISGRFGFQILDPTGTKRIDNVHVDRVWTNCDDRGKFASFNVVAYPEKGQQILSEFNQAVEFGIQGRLFGEEFTWWLVLKDPVRGTSTAKLAHVFTEKVPAGFGAWEFERTVVFENVPKKNLNLEIYSDAVFEGHADGEPYVQKIVP